MKAVIIFSIIGFVGWALILWVLVGLSGIGDGSGAVRTPPASCYLPFAYFIICVLSCVVPRWLLLPFGIGGGVCLASTIYFLIAHGAGWPVMVISFLIILLLGHAGVWLEMLIEQKKNENRLLNSPFLRHQSIRLKNFAIKIYCALAEV